MTHVLLLRAREPARDSCGKDAYETQLVRVDSVVTTSFVPVYETVQVLDKLQRIIEAGPVVCDCNGVIITSRRAVDAWAAAATAASGSTPPKEQMRWRDVPFFVVGSATARALHEMCESLSSQSRDFAAPGNVLGSEETGTGDQLAYFIRNYVERERSAPCPPAVPGNSAESARAEVKRTWKLLFLTGDKTRNSLPEILGKCEGIELESVQVYATGPSPEIPNALRDTMRSVGPSKAKNWWIVFFAPSSADYTLSLLGEYFTLPEVSRPEVRTQSESKEEECRNPIPIARLAAIGPTTAAYLRETLKLEVAAVAAKPNAEELAAAIKLATA